MPDPTKPRHEVKTWVNADDEQIEFERLCEGLARDGYTGDDGVFVPPDPDKQAHCAAIIDVLTECRDFFASIAPDVPKDAS